MAVLVIIPTALHASGVITWAVRLVSALADRGHASGLLIHGESTGPMTAELSPAVRVFEHPELPHLDALAGDLSDVIPVYGRAIETMREGADDNEPVVVSPNLHADCYGAVAALTMNAPDRLRVLGWAHSDNSYDVRVLGHYQPMLHGVVAVSETLQNALLTSLPGRQRDTTRIPYGVPIARSEPGKETDDGPVRLVYAGRIEDEQKRASALLEMSRTLVESGVEHELRILGDGSERMRLERLSTESPSIRWLGTCAPAEVRASLAWADAFVLPSAYEGLSVSMLEAMAAGCAPVVARVRSGAAEAIEHAGTGLLVEVGDGASIPDIGERFAHAIASTPRHRLRAIGQAAQRCATDRYGIERHADAVVSLLARVAAMPPRPWPATRPAAFQGTGIGSGSVPADAARRLRTAFDRLKGRCIGVHGTGRHTRELASVFASCPAISAFCDDDPAKRGGRIWNWPIISPEDARAHGVDVVVISSSMHEVAIWNRRSVYTSQGIEVVRLYDA